MNSPKKPVTASTKVFKLSGFEVLVSSFHSVYDCKERAVYHTVKKPYGIAKSQMQTNCKWVYQKN